MEYGSTVGGTPSAAGSLGLAPSEASVSGISWAAVIGGAVAAAALALILLALGTGLGLSSISPWSHSGISAHAFGTSAIIWLIVTQIIASAMGGYLAGRLRTKWTDVHSDEVYFRDTAHGLLVWAVGVIITAGLLMSAATAMVSGAAQACAVVASSVSSNGETSDPSAYFVDALFRSNQPNGNVDNSAVRGEAGRIFAVALRDDSLAMPDRTYLATLVATRTGLSQQEAEQRVSQLFMASQRAVDQARKTAAHLSLWIFVALLAGAFFSSYAATIGGRQRDHLSAV